MTHREGRGERKREEEGREGGGGSSPHLKIRDPSLSCVQYFIVVCDRVVVAYGIKPDRVINDCTVRQFLPRRPLENDYPRSAID